MSDKKLNIEIKKETVILTDDAVRKAEKFAWLGPIGQEAREDIKNAPFESGAWLVDKFRLK